MKALIIYHSRDIDGWLSGAIADRYYESLGYDTKTIGWDYGNPIIPITEVEDANVVFIADVELPMYLYHYCYDNGIELIWCDHHISNIEKAPKSIIGLRDTQFAACELTWLFLNSAKPMPELVRLAGAYDCFRHKGTGEEQYVLDFQFGLRSVIKDITSARTALAADGINLFDEYSVVQNGRRIREYLNEVAIEDYNSKTVAAIIEGVTWGIINRERFNPINYNINYHKDGYDVYCCYWYSGEKWNFSLYNDNGLIDCSAIAKTYGGGGHKGAAGFTMTHMQLGVFLTTIEQ